jgi:hypothetical protein
MAGSSARSSVLSGSRISSILLRHSFAGLLLASHASKRWQILRAVAMLATGSCASVTMVLYWHYNFVTMVPYSVTVLLLQYCYRDFIVVLPLASPSARIVA